MAKDVAKLADSKEPVIVEASKTELFLPIDEFEQFAGAGAENVTIKDQLLPRLTILQALSPQVNKKKAEFIEGAEVGDWCNVATGDIYKESIMAIACHFRVSYIEWGKNRSGLVKNYGSDSSILDQTTQNEKRENVLPNGNKIVETSEWFVLVQDGILWKPAFLPLVSTNLKVSRKWMTLNRGEVLQGKHGPFSPPLFYRSWNLRIVSDSNDQGDWYTFMPSSDKTILEIDPSKALLNQAKQFWTDVREDRLRGDLSDDDPNKAENARIGNDSSKM